MPMPLDPQCASLLFNVAMQFGALASKAIQPISTWDQEVVDLMIETLLGVPEVCAGEIADECWDTVETLEDNLKAIKNEGREAVPDKVPELLATTGKSLQYFLTCITNGYAMYGFVTEEGPVFPDEYPKGDWLSFEGLEPQRRKQVR